MHMTRPRKHRAVSAVVVVAVLAIVGVGLLAASLLQGGPSGTAPGFRGQLQGAGATFPYPFYSKLAAEYSKVVPGVQVNYNSIGSGGGIRQFTDKTVDFGASDAPLTEAQYSGVEGVLHVPMVIGGVVAAYNVPGLSSGLRLTGDVLARIFLGEITSWGDQDIRSLNPSLDLPDKPIVVVHRSDGSGTTFVWTQYLSTVSEAWASRVGASTSVNWPVGLGGSGNNGVAGLIQQNPYSIGYVEYTYAVLNDMTVVYLQNAAGMFVPPTAEAFSAAAEAASLSLPRGDQSWSQVSIVRALANDTRAGAAYPVTSFTYVLIYRDMSVVPGMNLDKARALVKFLWWAIHEGQSYAQPLGYVPLPSSVVTLDEATLRMVTFSGEPLL